MLQAGTLIFLENLAANNHKEWLDANRKIYETARKDYEGFVQTILNQLATTEDGFMEQRAKDCMFRIFRDVRFSKNKDPYKTNFGAVFSKRGKKDVGGGYYVHLEPNKSFIGGGIWQPEPDMLKKIRQEIDYNFDEFNAIISSNAFKKYFTQIDGEHLKNPPKGYDATNPAIEFLKLKSFTVGTHLKDESFTQKGIEDKVLHIFQAMQPFIAFLNRAVE